MEDVDIQDGEVATPSGYDATPYGYTPTSPSDGPSAYSPTPPSFAPSAPSAFSPTPRTGAPAASPFGPQPTPLFNPTATHGPATPAGPAAAQISGPTARQRQVGALLYYARGAGRYWSFTTTHAPFLPWAPLSTRGDKENRPCHCSMSRVHRLRCGHLVAMPDAAEICAQNCAGMVS
jgi:hypothetical protein